MFEGVAEACPPGMLPAYEDKMACLTAQGCKQEQWFKFDSSADFLMGWLQIFIGTGQNYKAPENYTMCKLMGASDEEDCGLRPNYVRSITCFGVLDAY